MLSTSIAVFQAKTHLSAILEEVNNGKSFTITRHGQPVARIVPIAAAEARPRRGSAKGGSFRMAKDFDAPVEDFSEYM